MVHICNEMWRSHKNLACAITWMDLKDIVLSEMRKTNVTISLTCGI